MERVLRYLDKQRYFAKCELLSSVLHNQLQSSTFCGSSAHATRSLGVRIEEVELCELPQPEQLPNSPTQQQIHFLNSPLATDAFSPSSFYKSPNSTPKMAPDVVSKLQTLVTGESKTARKKKAKAETGSTAVPAAPENTASEAGADGSNHPEKANGTDSDNAYVKELQK